MSMRIQQIFSISVAILCTAYVTLCWKIILDYPEIGYTNPDVCELNSTVTKINKTTIASNISLQLFQDIPVDADLHIELYGFFSNSYRSLPLNVIRKVCIYFDFEYKFFKDELHGYLPEECPVRKGVYYARNYVPNSRKFPISAWTTNKYCLQLTLLYENVKQCQFRMYVTITRDV